MMFSDDDDNDDNNPGGRRNQAWPYPNSTHARVRMPCCSHMHGCHGDHAVQHTLKLQASNRQSTPAHTSNARPYTTSACNAAAQHHAQTTKATPAAPNRRQAAVALLHSPYALQPARAYIAWSRCLHASICNTQQHSIPHSRATAPTLRSQPCG